MKSAITGTGSVTLAELEQPSVAALLRGERLRSVNLEGRLLLAAARLALRDAELPEQDADQDDLGVVVATRHAGLHDYVELYLAGMDAERPHVSPARGPQTGLNAPAAHLSIRLRAAGPNATVSSGAVSGLDALIYADAQLTAGHAHTMLVCGVDAPPAVAEPARSSQRGSASVMVLEAAHVARARGARVRAVVGSVATAHAPDGDAAKAEARAVHEALTGAGGDRAAARTWSGNGSASDDMVASVAAAAASLGRREAAGPLLVSMRDDAAAGAAVLAAAGDDGATGAALHHDDRGEVR